ncbi:Asp-tRNA(Asn)/Glu-tRNA(Gln) amidotransferase subunit GatA [Clostridium botulinum]|uniref:Glutamyl-tRNA(Gln) amidotransferase subunit A n=1 Tax=Clostridium botulinum C/D str. DC5 TaxID=1443128 RepID=A0A0A0II19_CLOBO|nr:Asp-tRNA(Asn)/Glu-tRNA(Gln) amidotransferase subunit GatA [Clostridium botulinum]KEI00189.1 glutamyl-tRNA amidotransferase [Clostridium botulinum C/D str. BKT75002]KEI09347.1 glutamyl-tRNA amidotransferase [Clostridium botulinum C/D str. BKT2873]KGM94661.1 glutamyl-tRNA amidotransferase [Clostridium botulinum D str. CCUG 7971]KGM99896.1 glutamyl-tRNA amidotransferase [Clostridium botulinum C/D str. DC5]KOC49399.1 glutamyl-tRNA amidotransferase [Clostridium botulinum]
MEIYQKTAHELIDMIKNKEIKVEEVVQSYLNRIDNIDETIGSYLYVSKEKSLKQAKKLDNKIKRGDDIKDLYGIPIGVKDNISVKNMQNTCASKMLENYISPYDATVISKLKENHAIIIGKLNMDEFAMGSSNENSAFKVVKNPWDLERIPGGSSGGSAAAVASGEVPLTLGTETGGSVRQPASLCGVVGLKPTYGRISRYGVTSFASTLDQVGTIGRDVTDCAILTEAISGFDQRDSTSSNKYVPNFKVSLKRDIKGKKIAIPKEFFEENLEYGIRKSIEEAIGVLRENGAEIMECSLPLIDYSLAAYYIISSAEASSNLARIDGIRYGKRIEKLKNDIDIYIQSRNEGFGKEVKRRIMLGTYVLSKGYYEEYYEKALKVRSLIKNDFEKILKTCDAIITPTSPTTAFKIGQKTKDILSMYSADIYTVPINIAGLPAISVPCGFSNNLPVGLQIIGNYFKEDMLFNIGYSYEQSTNWHKRIPRL